MPRIPGFGDLDWVMPGETATQDLSGNRGYYLNFRFVPDRPVDFTGRHGEPSQGLVYRSGKCEPQNSRDDQTGVTWTDEDLGIMIPSYVRQIARALSHVPEIGRVQVVWRQTEPVFFYLTIAMVGSGTILRFPTRFIQALVRKVAKHVATN